MQKKYLSHHGVKGQRWGVRKDPEKGSISKRRKKPLTEKQKTNRKVVLGIAGGLAAGAAAAGLAWYTHNKRQAGFREVEAAMMRDWRSNNAKKGWETRRKATKTFKNVDVLISTGSDFIAQFKNASITKVTP